MDDEHSEIKIVASDEEHKLITTNPDEILELQANSKENKIEKIDKGKGIGKINKEQRVFSCVNLSKKEKEYLLLEGFKEFKHTNVLGKKEIFLTKQYKNESARHMVLIYEIVEYLKKFTKDIETYLTVKPDIVFSVNNQKYAIEVETGSIYKDRKKMQEKVNSLKKEYGKNWFFVVTDWNIKKAYERCGKTYVKRNVISKINKIVKRAKIQ